MGPNSTETEEGHTHLGNQHRWPKHRYVESWGYKWELRLVVEGQLDRYSWKGKLEEDPGW